MNNILNNSIKICIILILVFVSCEDNKNSKLVISPQELKKTDTTVTNNEPTITSTDKKWAMKMFRTKKSEIRFGSGGELSNFKSREFYCLEITPINAYDLGINDLSLHIQTSPSAPKARLSVFVYDNKIIKYSQITEGYDFKKNHIQFMLSTDVFNGFNNDIKIAVGYYGYYPLNFNPYSESLPLILFNNIPVEKISESLISEEENNLKANDEWFRVNGLENGVIGVKKEDNKVHN